MKTRIAFLSLVLACFSCFAQRAQVVSGLTQAAGSAVNASAYMNTVLTNTSASDTRTALGIVDLVGTNGILLSSSNLVGWDTAVATVSGTSNITFHGKLTGDGSGLTGTGSTTLLNSQGATSALTGNSGDQALYTYSVPSIAAGKGIRWTVYFKNTTATSASKGYKISFGGTSLTLNPSTSTSTSNPFMASGTIMNAPSSTTSQVWGAGHVQNGGSFAQFISTSAVDTSGAQTLSFIFNAANTEACTGTMFFVEAIQ